MCREIENERERDSFYPPFRVSISKYSPHVVFVCVCWFVVVIVGMSIGKSDACSDVFSIELSCYPKMFTIKATKTYSDPHFLSYTSNTAKPKREKKNISSCDLNFFCSRCVSSWDFGKNNKYMVKTHLQ